MKKGKTIKINQYESLKTSYGTVDSKNLKCNLLEKFIVFF
jgi:hypothetical protein